MAKSERTKIEFDYDNQHYCLCYTVNSLRKLERAGVKFAKLSDMVLTAPEIIFRGAFYANHPTVSEKTVQDIYRALKRTAEDAGIEYDDDGREVDQLQIVLSDMVSEAVDELMGRGDKGNIVWKRT